MLDAPDFFQTAVEQGEVGPEQKLAPISPTLPRFRLTRNLSSLDPEMKLTPEQWAGR